jgi:prenyltransferase beta subunit
VSLITQVIPFCKVLGGTSTSGKTIQEVRTKTLQYIERMRLHNKPFGSYRYSDSVTEPTLYSSTYAAMTRSLYRDIGTLSRTERREWVEYLQSHQDDDGLYRDPLIYDQGWYKDDPEWCGRRHLTCHVITALKCLGAIAVKTLQMLEPFYEKAKLTRWLEARDWSRVDFAGNEVLNLGTLLQYARDFQKEKRAGKAVKLLLDWLAGHHMNPETGLWGTIDIKESKGLSRTVMGAYHFWLLFFYDHMPVPFADNAVTYILKTQQTDGGFGCGVHGPKSSACEDIDSIDPLARLSFLVPSDHKDKIISTLKCAEPHVLAMQNDDGGFVWVRGTAFSYGHSLMTSAKDASGMFPTWFRTLSLAYLGKALAGSVTGSFDWYFCNVPGIQFWQTGAPKSLDNSVST